MEPNLELVTGSFFTGMSKAGGILRERIFEASLKRNFPLLLMALCVWGKFAFLSNKGKNFAFYMLTQFGAG